jgi:hypothetical protein
VPSYANPQSLNRYSYVVNNPLLYTDPSGHRPDDGYVGNHSSHFDCGKYSQYCTNGKKKSDKELQAMHPQSETNGGGDPSLWITNFADGGRGSIHSWDGHGEIDPVEWNELLKNVGDNVHTFSTGWYDTPFFNNYSDSGIGCFNGGRDCYDRSELNYIGEGEALAALGLSKEVTHNVVWAWKNAKPFMFGLAGLDSTPKKVTPGTYEMTDVGWDYYHTHYSSVSQSVISIIMPPGIAPSLGVP